MCIRDSRYNIPSEASQRFERGVNPAWVAEASGRAALLMAELAGGKVLRGLIDSYPAPAEPRRVTVVSYTHLDVYKRQLNGPLQVPDGRLLNDRYRPALVGVHPDVHALPNSLAHSFNLLDIFFDRCV